MKTKLIVIAIVLAAFFSGCNKEEAITPSADFTTNIQNNTLNVGQPFTVYLNNVTGEFRVYFKGATEETTYDAADETRLGTPISNDVDSLNIMGYTSAGQYTFTVVASSSGNWAEDYLQDVKSVTITVQ